jgi:hypothetical protein
MTTDERRKLVTERRRISRIRMKHDYFLTKLSYIESDIGVKLTKDNVMQHYREIIRMPNIGKVYVNKLRTYLDTA